MLGETKGEKRAEKKVKIKNLKKWKRYRYFYDMAKH